MADTIKPRKQYDDRQSPTQFFAGVWYDQSVRVLKLAPENGENVNPRPNRQTAKSADLQNRGFPPSNYETVNT
jgi:hypothetical protein